MARKKHLINVHTSTGTTAPTGASLYLGEIAVQHTTNDPALWIKVGSAETSTTYEKFIGETEINNEFNKTNHNIPYVVQGGDTYTGSTDAYVAESLELLRLTEGQSIIFHPKQASKTGNSVSNLLSSCTLDIKLADGTMTGPNRLYLKANSKITTHITGCTDIKLTYHENATWSGVTGLSGWWTDFYYDSNSDVLAHGIYYANTQRVVTSQMYRYRLMFSSADEKYWVPANSATSTNATTVRSATTTPIDPFGPIAYYATTTVVSSGASPGGSAVYTQYSAVTLGYSFVFANSAMTAKLPVYLKCEPQADGSAIIDATTPIVQELPLTEDGKIYIFLGVAISATVFQLYEQHPVYEYKYGHIRQYQEDNAPEMILGSGYTYSGLSYINSATQIADAFSALTEELFNDEEVTASALNDLNNRVNILSADSADSREIAALSASVISDERVTAAALNDLNARLVKTLTGVTVNGESAQVLSQVAILDIAAPEFILGSGYTYSGIPYVNSSTTIADAYSALTKELIDDEKVISAAFNDLNGRVVEISASSGDYGQIIHEDEETTAAALNQLNDRVTTVETRMTGDYIPITGYILASGKTEGELGLSEDDTVTDAFGKIQKQILDDEEAIAACLNDLNQQVSALTEAVEHSAGVAELSASVVTLSSATEEFSATTYWMLDSAIYNTNTLSGAVRSFSSATNTKISELSGTVQSVSALTNGVLTLNLNGVEQGIYSPSADTTINLEAIQEITGADILLTGYGLATGSTEEELVVVATDTVNEAIGKLQKQNYDNEVIVSTALNELNYKVGALIPPFTAQDEGKVLMVSGGTLVWVTPQW